MTTCIYYEQEAITADDVRQARALAGSGACESAPSGADWANDIPGPLPEREPNHRSLQYLDALMPWLARFGDSLEQSAGDVARRHGASLAEIAKFELLFDLAPAEQRWHALSNILRRWNPDRLVWVTAGRWPDAELKALARAAAPTRVEFRRAANHRATSWRSAWESLKIAVGPPVKSAASIARAAVRRPRWPASRAGVVFTENFPNSVFASLPIAETLHAEHGVDVCWLAARRKVAEALRSRGVASLVLPELLSARAHRYGRLNGRQRKAVRSALENLPDELFCGTGQPGGREYFLAILERRVLSAWNHAAFWIEAYREAFAALRPEVVVSTTYSSVMGRAAALAAREFGARSVYLQHGLFPDYAVFSSFCNDLLLMWGQYNFRSLTHFGIDPGRIRVVGATMYDKLRRTSGEQGSLLRRAGQPLEVAYMASRTGGMLVSHAKARLCLLAVAGAVRAIDNGHLTVKIHPGDHTSLVDEVIQQFPDFKIVRSGSSQDVIEASDLVIVASSTTGLEACAAEKPLVVLDVIDDPDAVPYASYGAALSVSVSGTEPAEELRHAIESLLHDPGRVASLALGRRRLLDDMLNGSNGDAAHLAAAAVLELLRRPVREMAPQNSG